MSVTIGQSSQGPEYRIAQAQIFLFFHPCTLAGQEHPARVKVRKWFFIYIISEISDRRDAILFVIEMPIGILQNA